MMNETPLPQNTPSGQYEIQKIRNRSYRINRLAVAGVSNVEIAKRCGCTAVTVATHLRSAVTADHRDSLQTIADKEVQDIDAKLKDMADKAVKFMDKVLTDPVMYKQETVMRIAFGALDRSGHSPIQRIKGEIDHNHFTTDDLDSLRELGKQRRLEASTVIDVEAVATEDQLTHAHAVAASEAQASETGTG